MSTFPVVGVQITSPRGGAKPGLGGANYLQGGAFVSFRPILAKNKREAYASLLFLVHRKGLVEGGHAEGGAKNMPATCFLARGRVHESMTAARRAVGIDPLLLHKSKPQYPNFLHRSSLPDCIFSHKLL